MPLYLIRIIKTLLDVFSFILVIRIVLSWVHSRPGGFLADVADVVFSLTEPLLAPIRKIIPPIAMGMGYLDLSPLILMVLLSLLRRMLF